MANTGTDTCVTRFTSTTLHIQKVSSGGYIVTDGVNDPRYPALALLACSEIGEALKFIETTLNPPASKPEPTAAEKFAAEVQAGVEKALSDPKVLRKLAR